MHNCLANVSINNMMTSALAKCVPNATYTLYGNQLSLVHEARDLGVLIDTQLSYKQHISNVVALSLIHI